MKWFWLLLCTYIVLTGNLYAGDTTNLEGAWLLDEASGTRVDETANNNDLTDNNTVGQATGASCQFDECADFERDNSETLSITDGSQTGLDVTGDYSVGCWADLETTGEAFIMDKFVSNTGYQWGINASSKMFMINAAGALSLDTGTALSTTLVHVGYAYDDSANNVIFYHEGAVNSTITANTNPNGSTDSFIIGTNGSIFLDAILDECFFFSRELSLAEFQDIRSNGLASFISPVTRNRLIIIALVVNRWIPAFQDYFRYYSLVNDHRVKFDIERPLWMKLIFDWKNPFKIPEANAATPTIGDKTQATIELNKRKTTDNVKVDGKYIQRLPMTNNGIMYETHVYDGPRGVGYIQRARKTQVDGEYYLERHFGVDRDRPIKTDWTKSE